MFLSNLLSKPLSKQTLYYTESSLSAHILKSCIHLDNQFVVDRWLSNRHFQSAVTYLLDRGTDDDLTARREHLQVNDKGVVSLDWLKDNRSATLNNFRYKSNTRRILVIIPGLLQSRCEYKSLAVKALSNGYKVVVFNSRGCNGNPLTTSKIHQPGDPSDLRQAIKYIRARFPLYKRTAVSFSYGSVLLMSYLGEYGSSSYISAATCLSPWYTAAVTSDNKLNWIYDKLLKNIAQLWATKYYNILSTGAALNRKIFSARTTKELQDISVNAMFKYADVETFEESNCPIRDADDISTPVLCISSLDDPVVPSHLIPFDLFKVNLNLMLVATSHGGHGGYFNWKHQKCKWSDHVVLDYISAVLDFLQANNYSR